MAKFVYLYTGGQMAETPEAQEKVMQAWGAWLGGLGPSTADQGNAFGKSASLTSSGVGQKTSNIGGYSIITADSLDEATAKADGCPVLLSGGTVEVYEALEM